MRKVYVLLQLILVFIILINIHSSAYAQGYSTHEHWLDKKSIAIKSTIVLNKKEPQTIPLIDIDQMKIVGINFGFDYTTILDSILNKYQKVDRIDASSYLETNSLNALRDDVKFYNTLILEISDNYATDQRVISFIEEIEKSKRVIIAFFGIGKNLSAFDGVKSPIVWCKQRTPEAAMYVAQTIFGGVSINNVLEESYSDIYQAGLGTSIKKIRLGYTPPEEIKINFQHLQYIDTIALEAISQKTTPGAAIMVVKDGWVVYNKAFGTHTYESRAIENRIEDIYDLASVTKVAATTVGVMRLVEEEKIKLDQPLKNYIGRTRGLDKENLTLYELMLHQAGFKEYIPFYKKIRPEDYSQNCSEIFTTQVADNYYLRKNYFEQVMWPQMLNSPLVNRGKYVYSDISMYFTKEVAENVSGERLDQYVSDQFYKPLGMKTAGFNPRQKFKINQIVPTENDSTFRKSLLVGYVHDPGAAMLGGVAGHAGLFASTNDLAILFQMLLDQGIYGGKRYFKPKTIDLFTSKQSTISRRGLGFDRADPDLSKAYPSKLASSKTFGHTGFTGTCVWADPEYNLIYIFLSNRVNPYATSNRLAQLNIRSRIQDVIYEAIKKSN